MTPGIIGTLTPAAVRPRSASRRQAVREQRLQAGRTGRATPGFPPEEDVDVVEELGDDIVRSGIDLGLEELDVLVLGRRVGVRVGVAYGA
jgi:hypothetical protein